MISFRATDDVDGDGDDWGWDEPSEEGDIELAGSSDQSIPHPSSLSLSLKQRSPSIEKRDVVPSPTVTRQKALHMPPPSKMQSIPQPTLQPSVTPMNSQPQMITSLGPPPAPAMNSQPQMITSLGAPPPKKPTTARKPKEDDIFASMGLSAQPKFQTSRPAARPATTSSTSSGWGSLAAAPVSAPLPQVAPSSSFDAAGDEWGDDDDLDDLFDE